MADAFLISRRQLLKLAAAVGGSGLPLSDVFADASPSALVKRVVKAPANTYFTYPHSNGFLADGSCVLAAPTSGGEKGALDYIRFDIETGAASLITSVQDARMYYAVAANGLLLFNRPHGVSVVDVSHKNQSPREILSSADTYLDDCEISTNGRSALVTRALASNGSASSASRRRHSLDLINLESGTAKTLITADWVLDHAHFSPFDPSWICYACGEPKRYKRLWTWHATQAPNGKPLFKQIEENGTKFDIGHERAMFNKAALVVVAYGTESDAKPCGLYEVGFDGTVRLISESNRDFHCNISRDGRWAVVSLQGAFDHLDSTAESNWRTQGGMYGFSDVMVVNMSNGKRQFLYRATNSRSGQPYEVQPTISPDGRWVLLKDASEKRVIAIEMDLSKLQSFLG